VVGSNRVMEVNGKKVRGRQYPWGVVEVDNLQHNDFLALRDMLIRYAYCSDSQSKQNEEQIFMLSMIS